MLILQSFYEFCHRNFKSKRRLISRLRLLKRLVIDSLKPFFTCKHSADLGFKRDKEERLSALDSDIFIDLLFGVDLEAGITETKIVFGVEIDTVDFGR